VEHDEKLAFQTGYTKQKLFEKEDFVFAALSDFGINGVNPAGSPQNRKPFRFIGRSFSLLWKNRQIRTGSSQNQINAYCQFFVLRSRNQKTKSVIGALQ